MYALMYVYTSKSENFYFQTMLKLQAPVCTGGQVCVCLLVRVYMCGCGCVGVWVGCLYVHVHVYIYVCVHTII
jgi:hypothetical protein